MLAKGRLATNVCGAVLICKRSKNLKVCQTKLFLKTELTSHIGARAVTVMWVKEIDPLAASVDLGSGSSEELLATG